jgi:hypothetical protein
MAIRDKIVAIATDYSNQNITEIQPNNGWTDPGYQADMQSIGWEKGDEWCAAAAILSWKKGYASNLDVWQRAANLVSLNCQEMARQFHADPVWPTSVDVPVPGAIAVWQAGDSAVEGHCGIVISINGDIFITVEGNTTSETKPNPDPTASVRDGWTVAAHSHTVGQPHSSLGLNLVRFIYAIESYSPLVV